MRKFLWGTTAKKKENTLSQLEKGHYPKTIGRPRYT